ncbi:diacylglycerol kinase [Nocardioides sp. R-C-SC26]|uniref:NAD(P)H-dependent amine dehydrogenase family protein n=1 Tax=Nocardioides sp. R-C-SC26 TaxID=2870414 RepID=UPI001E5606BE|nr:diacylglycerol kinase [Nocardioides sp. R-C-SC26]
MAIRVAHVGTGNVGRLALKHLILDDRFELTGLCVSTEEKLGRDAGELAGLDIVTGISAVGDLDALLATEPDCVMYCALGEVRFFEAIEDVKKLLAAGVDVCGTSPGSYAWPWKVLPASFIEQMEDACREGRSSLFINGVDPGWANDLMAFSVLSTCRTVQQIRVLELADYATYDGAPVMIDVMGFGMGPDQIPMLLTPGVLKSAWGTTIHQIAAGLGIEVDDIEESYEREWATEDLEVAVGTIHAGTQSALRFEVRGMVAGHPAIVVEHVTRTADDQRPDWARPAQEGGSYRIEITGEPSYVVDICPTSAEGDHNHAAILVGAGRVVNAIPDVVAAAPGIRTTLDLPVATGRGVYAPPA